MRDSRSTGRRQLMRTRTSTPRIWRISACLTSSHGRADQPPLERVGPAAGRPQAPPSRVPLIAVTLRGYWPPSVSVSCVGHPDLVDTSTLRAAKLRCSAGLKRPISSASRPGVGTVRIGLTFSARHRAAGREQHTTGPDHLPAEGNGQDPGAGPESAVHPIRPLRDVRGDSPPVGVLSACIPSSSFSARCHRCLQA